MPNIPKKKNVGTYRLNMVTSNYFSSCGDFGAFFFQEKLLYNMALDYFLDCTSEKFCQCFHFIAYL